MLANIRKHQGWLWIIIAVVVIAFVLWGSQTQRMSNAIGSSGNYGVVLGKSVSAEQYHDAYNEARLRYFFANGEWPGRSDPRSSFDEERDTYLRLLLIREMDEMGIHVSAEAAGAAATARIMQVTQGRQMKLEDFVSHILEPAGVTDADFARYINHEVGLQELISLIGASGRMVTPDEIRGLYQREHEEVAVQAVFFTASNYLDSVNVTRPAFLQYYTNQMSTYHLPERVQVNYVRFAASNYLAEGKADLARLTNLDEIVDADYERLGTNFDAEAKTPAEKKAKIRQKLLDNQALLEATKRAGEFTQNLEDLEPKQGDLAVLAGSNGLAVHLSEPFDRDTPPEALDVGMDFVQHAFELGPDGWFFGPIKGLDATYVIELAKQLPDENPPFEQISNRVLADYKMNQAVMIARLTGNRFYQSVTNGMGKGRSFSTICAEAGVHPDFLPPLSISTRSLPEVEDRVSLNSFKETIFGTGVGQVSPFAATIDGGYLAYVHNKLPLESTQMQLDYPKFAAMVQNNRENEAVNAWINHEAARGLRDTPFMQRQQQQQQSGASGAAPPPPSPQN